MLTEPLLEAVKWLWRRRPAWLVAGIAVGFLAGAAVVVSLVQDDPEPLPSPARASWDVPADQALELAKRFRPWLRFDSSEPWRPLDLRRLLDEQPRHELCLRHGACQKVGDLDAFAQAVSDAGAFGDESFLNIEGDGPADFRSPALAECGAEPPLQDCDTGPSSSIYFRVSGANDRYYIDYWWFLRFNDNFPNSFDHEGDWEGVTAVTAANDPDTLDYVSFASHEGRFRYTAGDLERERDGRPDVFLANGSHAAYAHACADSRLVCQQLVRYKRVAQIPERRFNGKRSWGRNENAACFTENPADDCLRELPRVDLTQPLRSWTVWSGLWGASCGKRCAKGGTDSPRSPGRQDRYGSPWCSTSARGRQCDSVALGCDAWLGPLVAVAICVPKSSAESRAATAIPVVTVDGERSSYSSTAGIVQVLGRPLTRDRDVRFAGVARAGVQVIVRAQDRKPGGRVVEARFDGATLGTEPLTLVVDETDSHPRLLLQPAAGAPVEPVDVRTFRPVPTNG